jgi:hypothetical protein
MPLLEVLTSVRLPMTKTYLKMTVAISKVEPILYTTAMRSPPSVVHCYSTEPTFVEFYISWISA